jgi:UDP-glucose 4-epimerase
MKVLVAGGAGYIGSTIASACLDAGHEPVILDDLSTGCAAFTVGRPFVLGDMADAAAVDEVFMRHPDIGLAVHCAAHVVVPDSVRDPLSYYFNNVAKTVAFAGHLRRNGCRRLLFSSSAAVYAFPNGGPVTEDSPIAPASPYGRTKVMVEQILADAARAGDLDAVALRYFNPIGADPMLRTGQQMPAPTHALGRLLAAHRSGGPFVVAGTDWPTRDGTGLRDYVHVWDLAQAHLCAIDRFDALVDRPARYVALNVGTGQGTTVRELVASVVDLVGPQLSVVDGPRRPGDTAGGYAAVDRARAMLGWQAALTVADGVRDALAWLAIREDLVGGAALLAG